MLNWIHNSIMIVINKAINVNTAICYVFVVQTRGFKMEHTGYYILPKQEEFFLERMFETYNDQIDGPLRSPNTSFFSHEVCYYYNISY